MPNAGYLISVDNVPPLVFKFQFNPEALSEKKTFKYDAVNQFGRLGFDQTSAASGFFGTLGGLAKDIKEISSLLIAVKPMEPKEGEPRVFSIDFALDGYGTSDNEIEMRYPNNSIEPDLDVLRAFMLPWFDLIDLGKLIFTQTFPACWKTPPACTLVYGGLSVKCVMTDLTIKVVQFNDDMSPRRAEINVQLKEQSDSFHPLVELVTRNINIVKSYGRGGDVTVFKDIADATGMQKVIDALS